MKVADHVRRGVLKRAAAVGAFITSSDGLDTVAPPDPRSRTLAR